MPDLFGKTLGDYEVQELLGVGAMGRVYRALQQPFRRPVALKVLEDGLNTPDETVERFLREAEAMSRLEHPHILPIYAAGHVPPHRWIAMRLVKDGTLNARMQVGRYPDLPAAVTWLRQVVWALSHAHSRGIIHRDIKPSNILLAGGVAFLADFGIARLKEHSTITSTGSILGTPLYLSPEQTAGKRAGAASDLFSVGVILYEIACQKHPFLLESEDDLPLQEREDRLFRRISQSLYPAPRGENAELSKLAESILVRCLQRKPEDRHPSAMELLKDLNLLQLELGQGDLPEGRDAMTVLPSTLPGVKKGTGKTQIFRKKSESPPGGRPFGRYLLYEELGHGATGVVYRGYDPELDRPTAVKVLRAGKRARPIDLEMFRHEARVSARLNHPHVVDIYDAGVAEDQPYLVMELVAGPSLDKVIRANGPLPVRFALETVHQALLGLRAAHRIDIIHLDVKPGNLLLREGAEPAGDDPNVWSLSRPHVLLSDFTLAKFGIGRTLHQRMSASAHKGATADIHGAGQAPTAQARTAGRAKGDSSVLGTPAYMSPEQASGEWDGLDARSDIFSMGAVLYHMLSGKSPFGGAGSDSALLRAKTGKYDTLRRLRQGLPASVDAICRKAMEKEARNRIPNADAFITAVEAELEKPMALDTAGN